MDALPVVTIAVSALIPVLVWQMLSASRRRTHARSQHTTAELMYRSMR